LPTKLRAYHPPTISGLFIIDVGKWKRMGLNLKRYSQLRKHPLKTPKTFQAKLKKLSNKNLVHFLRMET